jgi:hypothetical protein
MTARFRTAFAAMMNSTNDQLHVDDIRVVSVP